MDDEENQYGAGTEGLDFMNALSKMYRSIDSDIIGRILRGDKILKSRYIIDMIDTLYMNELNKDSENRKKLRKHIAAWAKGSGIPPNILSTLI